MTFVDTVAAEELAGWKRNKSPPTYREFAATMKLPAGVYVGHSYNPDSDPCQSYLISQLDLGCWERIYVCTAPQVGGKTLVAVMLPALRGAIACGLPVGYGLPTLSDLDKAWAEKLKPAIERSGYRDHMPKSGPGSKGGRGPTLRFRHPETGDEEGALVFMAGGAYGSTAAAVVIDEVDQFRQTDGTPLWESIEDIFSRCKSYGDAALRIAVGTVEDDRESIILTMVNVQGTGTRPWLRCPHCHRHQIVGRSQLVYTYQLQGEPGKQTLDEDAVRSSAAIVCSHCAALWDELGRLDAIRHCRFAHRGQTIDATGKTTGEAPRTRSLGLLWTSWESTLARLSDILIDHAKARLAREITGNPALMRKWTRYNECTVFRDESADRPDMVESVLYEVARLSTYTRGEVPPGAELIVLGGDVQLRQHYWIVVAMTCAPDPDWWIIDWGNVAVCGDLEQPTLDQREAILDKQDDLARGGYRQGTRTMTIVGAGIDTGFRPEEIRPWVAGRTARWISVKGAGDELVSRMTTSNRGTVEQRAPGWFDIREQDSEPDRRQMFTDDDALLDRIAAGWHNGKGHLPRDADYQLVKHLVGMRPGKRKRWEPRGSRRDLLDSLIYALAVGRWKAPSVIDIPTADHDSVSREPAWIDAGDKPWIN